MKPPTGRKLLFGILLSLFLGALVYPYGVWAGELLLAAHPEELRGLMLKLALGLLLIATAVGAVAGWVVWRFHSRRVDWDRIMTEQRLWESGPLGRAWLRARQRILGRN